MVRHILKTLQHLLWDKISATLLTQNKYLKNLSLGNIIWDKGFKNGLSKICERQPLKNLKGYGLLKQTIKFF